MAREEHILHPGNVLQGKMFPRGYNKVCFATWQAVQNDLKSCFSNLSIPLSKWGNR